jgi:multiple sugar transport system substrate-binding protein
LKRASVFAISGILGLAVVLLVACLPQPSAPAEAKTVLVFQHANHPNSGFLHELIQRFEAENPGVEVEERILPSDSDQQHQFYVINLAAHSTEADILDLDIIWAQEFARAGWLEPLDKFIPSEEIASSNHPALEPGEFRGRRFALPWFVDAGVLYYRRDLLEKYGFQPPQTYFQLVEASRAIQAREGNTQLNGFIWQGMQYEGLVCVALEMIRGNGGRILGPEGRAQVTSPATIDALQFMRNLEENGVSPSLVTTLSEESTRHLFQSGRAIFMRNWPYAWSLLNQPGSPVAGLVGMTLIPHFPGHPSVPTLGGYQLAVSAYSRHKKEAAAFVSFVLRYGNQRDILFNLGVLPANMQVYADPEALRRFPFLKDIVPTLEQARSRPVSPYYPMISQILQPEFSSVVAGVRRPAKAMQRASAEIDYLLRQQ